jgi:cell division protein FtsL
MATMAVGGQITGVYNPERGMNRVGSLWNGATPEVFFAKRIDNSRLVKLADPQRAREIRFLSVAGAIFFVVFLAYSFQHFRAIESSYKLEALRIQRDRMVEQNRELNLQQAALRDPQRIDALARKMGLEAPRPSQFVNLDTIPENAGAVYARVLPAPAMPVR